MKGQYYRIDWDTCDQLHLFGREAMVYCALIYLCKKAPYKGSATELADFSHCGTYMTALRMLRVLREKGFISIDGDGIRITQSVQSDTQSVQAITQSVQVSKEEKENQKKKENIKKDNEVSVSVTRARYTPTSASPQDLIFNNLFNMDNNINTSSPLRGGREGSIPANTGYYRIIVTEFGYMNPKLFVDEMYNFYNSHAWPKGNKLELMRWWMNQEPIKHPKRKPQLNEIERAVMRTFLDHIEERLIVRLLHIVRQFEVTDKVIYFYVPESNANDFVLWLNTLPLKLWFEAYNRTVSVRSLK